jgi:hypothetical protein
VARNDGIRAARGWVLAGVLLVLAGCATVGGRSPEEAVKERAQQRWDALVKGDFDAAYGFLSPGSRQVTKQPDYVASLRKGFWKDARVQSVTCGTQDACDVGVTIEYEYQGRKIRSPLRESWIRDGSTWWYVQKGS